MHTLSTKSIRLVAIAVVFGVAGFLTSGSRLLAGTAVDQHPELGDFGVDLTARDPAAKPGDDFYRYANGHWLDTFEIPADLSGYGAFTALFLRVEDQIKGIIEEQAKAGGAEGTLGWKIGELYSEYLDVDGLDAKGLTPLEPTIQKIDAAKTHEDIAGLMGEVGRVDGAGSYRGGGNTLFEFYIDQDEKIPTTYIPHFRQSGLGLPDRDYYLKDDNPRFVAARQAYRDYLEKLFTLAGKSDPGMRADRILAMETEVAKAHWPAEQTRDLDKTYNKLSRADIKKLAPDFPWDPYLDALKMGSQDKFIVMSPSAYTAMATVFKATPVDVWQDYLVYRVLRNNAPYLTKNLDDITFAFTSKAITGTSEQRDRWKRGVQFVNGTMGDAVGKLYVEKYFSPVAKARIDQLVKNLLVAMGDRIDHASWMSDATRKAAREKLAKFTVKIGYPDKWRDYSALEIRPDDLLGNAMRANMFRYDDMVSRLGKPVDRSRWGMTPQTVNAYYNSTNNEIVFPAAILQPPFFNVEADDAVNYGGIGAVIGHEISHGFDDQGSKSDGDGNLRDWFTPEDLKAFQERTTKLADQYSSYVPIDTLHINGRLTLGENIGDLSGLAVALRAYHMSLHGKEAPVIGGFTGDQRFFLGFAQVWKGKLRDAALASRLASNEHSPAECRVNGPLPNVDSWYTAFHVEPGDSLYLAPDKRIHIW